MSGRQQVRAYIFIFFLGMAMGARAQLKCKIEHYSTEDGLSHDGVMAMIKDREGFMWFGTWDGINRFDGRTFVTYKARPGDNSNLKSNRIDIIVEDRSGYLWLRAYDDQVYRFDKKTESFLGISETLITGKSENLLFEKIIPAEKKGFVWLVTRNQGIFCVRKSDTPHPEVTGYDSRSAAAFRLPPGDNNFLREDKQHHIWVGTQNGLACLVEDGSGTFKSINLGTELTKSLSFTCMAEGSDRIWFGTNKGYLVYYEKATKRFFRRRVTDHQLNAIQISKGERMLHLSTAASEVISLTTADFSTVVSKMDGAGPFFSIYEDRSGGLWVEPDTHGSIRLDPATGKFSYFFQENDATFHNPAEAYAVFEDTKGTVWVNMKGGGFGYYNAARNQIAYFYNQPGSANQRYSNLVSCYYYDPAGILWLSTKDRGINKVVFQGNDFRTSLLVNNPLNKSDNEIRGVYSDREGRLWLTSKSGMINITRNGRKITDLFTNMPPGGIGMVYTILEDSKANIWLGTKFNGLFKAEPLNPGRSKYRLTSYGPDEKDPYSLKSLLIYSVVEDQKGRIWIGTFDNGIHLLVQDGGKARFLNIQNTFKNYPKGPFIKVRNISCDEQGKIWLATTNGLLVLDPSKGAPGSWPFRTYLKIRGDKTSLGNNDVQHIFRDSRGRMWISTSGGGLNEAIELPGKEITFRSYTQEDGLPSDYIVSVIEDDHGSLWIASENGLSKFTPELRQFRNFNSYDGISKAGFSETSSLKLPSGELLFGGITGYLVFNPAGIVGSRIRANMVFTNLQINNKDVSPGIDSSTLKVAINNAEKLKIRYNENIISIDYTVLDYRSGNKQVYAYKLRGFDNEWHNVKNQHKATYTNLPPGNYVFEVKSTNNDLYWNTPSRTLPITILPPPWRTAWAYLAYAIIAVIIIEAARRIMLTMLRLRNRISVEQKLTELKLSFFTNISHELRTPLTLIVNPITEISQRESLSSQGKEYIQVVLKNANRMVRFINQLLDLRKVQSGKMVLKISRVELVSFIKDISLYFTEAAIEKQIDLSISSYKEEVFAWIDTEKMDIVIYNLLANAFKFTPAERKIQIIVGDGGVPGSIFISIADEGIGVPGNKLNDIFELYYEGSHPGGDTLKGTGIGLALSKELVQAHHGTISAKNNAGSGLTITVSLKAGRAHFNNDEIILSGDQVDQAGQLWADTSSEMVTDSVIELPDVPLVLIVEDNFDLRKFLANQFKDIYRIAEAENGEEGLDKAIKLLPDLVLSDVMMPKMDGITMLDALKNNLATSHIPVIILSAKFSVESQIEGLKYGADYYIAKPFHTDFVLASIANLLKQRKQLFNSLLAGKKKMELYPGEVVITARDEDFLRDIIRIVESGMADPRFNIDTVAESVGMGRTSFYKKFKSLTNLAPVEFVRDMRLKRAKQLLDAGESNIAGIAYSVGFSSGGYFSTCFKEAYHISPKEYLKEKGTSKAIRY